jgi:hypothetical protein
VATVAAAQALVFPAAFAPWMQEDSLDCFFQPQKTPSLQSDRLKTIFLSLASRHWDDRQERI